METEELGSVYESLLELTPVLSDDGRSMTFAVGDETKGNQRKTTGSYYTPDSLVQTLLDSALNPVLDRAEREAADPVEGLLELTVIDPGLRFRSLPACRCSSYCDRACRVSAAAAWPTGWSSAMLCET